MSIGGQGTTSRFERAIGRHRVRVEPPDDVTVVFCGKATVEEAEEFVKVMHEIEDQYGPVFVEADVRNFQSSGPRVRQVLAHSGGRPYAARAIAIWGASFATRTTINLVFRAASFLLQGRIPRTMTFVATQHEARAWLAKQREVQLQARPSRNPPPPK